MSQKSFYLHAAFVLVVSVLYFIEKYQVLIAQQKETSSEVVDKTDVPDNFFLPTTTTGTIVKHYYYTPLMLKIMNKPSGLYNLNPRINFPTMILSAPILK